MSLTQNKRSANHVFKDFGTKSFELKDVQIVDNFVVGRCKSFKSDHEIVSRKISTPDFSRKFESFLEGIGCHIEAGVTPDDKHRELKVHIKER